MENYAKFGFDNNFNHPIIIHDFDGSVRNRPAIISGQVLFSSPTYVAPSSLCSADNAVLGAGFYFCRSTGANAFKQYSATWHDQGKWTSSEH